MNLISWIVLNKVVLIELVPAIIGLASIVVKLTPTLKDDHILKGVIRFVGKFIALNRTEPKTK